MFALGEPIPASAGIRRARNGERSFSKSLRNAANWVYACKLGETEINWWSKLILKKVVDLCL